MKALYLLLRWKNTQLKMNK